MLLTDCPDFVYLCVNQYTDNQIIIRNQSNIPTVFSKYRSYNIKIEFQCVAIRFKY